MKLFAAHDREGTIQHIVVNPTNAPQGALAVPGEHLVCEIEAPDVSRDIARPESLERLTETIRDYRVETKVRRKDKLVKKQ